MYLHDDILSMVAGKSVILISTTLMDAFMSTTMYTITFLLPLPLVARFSFPYIPCHELYPSFFNILHHIVIIKLSCFLKCSVCTHSSLVQHTEVEHDHSIISYLHVVNYWYHLYLHFWYRIFLMATSGSVHNQQIMRSSEWYVIWACQKFCNWKSVTSNV